MKKHFLLLVIVYCTNSFAQVSNTNESLDKYFAGVPVRDSYIKWIQYILGHPDLGVDSLSERGAYSSFKPGIKDHFPFADSIQVKILFQQVIYYDSLTNVLTDSTNEISIEGVFPDNKTGKKASTTVFKQLRKVLGRNYRDGKIEYYPNGSVSSFSRGRNERFPDCSLQQGHSKELGFYFVIINYISPRKQLPKQY